MSQSVSPSESISDVTLEKKVVGYLEVIFLLVAVVGQSVSLKSCNFWTSLYMSRDAASKLYIDQ